MTLAVALSLLAALLFGSGTALQGHAAAVEPPQRLVEGRALARLLRRPVWLIGTALDWLGALTHLAALHFGALLVVQPLVLSAIVFAVPVEALLARRRPTRRRLLAAAQTSAGLALLALWSAHHLRHVAASPVAMVVGTALVLVGLGVLVERASRARHGRSQALLLGAAAGSAYGLSDALARTVQVTRLVPVLSAPWLLMLVTAGVVGGAGLLLTQLALQRASLSASLPVQDTSTLVLSVVMGCVLLGEVPDVGVPALAGGALALALVVHGIRTLAGTVPALPSVTLPAGQERAAPESSRSRQ